MFHLSSYYQFCPLILTNENNDVNEFIDNFEIFVQGNRSDAITAKTAGSAIFIIFAIFLLGFFGLWSLTKEILCFHAVNLNFVYLKVTCWFGLFYSLCVLEERWNKLFIKVKSKQKEKSSKDSQKFRFILKIESQGNILFTNSCVNSWTVVIHRSCYSKKWFLLTEKCDNIWFFAYCFHQIIIGCRLVIVLIVFLAFLAQNFWKMNMVIIL